MIKVNHKLNESMYEIIWKPVQNVNHGLVSYIVKVLHEEDKKVDSRVSILLKMYIIVIGIMFLYNTLWLLIIR